MKKLHTYIWEHKWGYLLAVSSLLIAVSLDLMSPQFTKHIVDDVIVGGDIPKLKWLLLGILGIGVGLLASFALCGWFLRAAIALVLIVIGLVLLN